MAWVKGQSGNPGGKSKGSAGIGLLRKGLWRRYGKDGRVLVDRIEALATDPQVDPSVRLKALDLLTAYHAGRPVQAVEHSGPEGAAIRSIIVEPPIPILPAVPAALPAGPGGLSVSGSADLEQEQAESEGG